jgi:hypothetical protein
MERFTIEGMENILNAMRENGHIFGWGYIDAGDAPEHPEVAVALFDDQGKYGETVMFQRDWLRAEMIKLESGDLYPVLLFANRIPELFRLMAHKFRKDEAWDDTHAWTEVA